jgi:hypothetical protein
MATSTMLTPPPPPLDTAAVGEEGLVVGEAVGLGVVADASPPAGLDEGEGLDVSAGVGVGGGVAVGAGVGVVLGLGTLRLIGVGVGVGLSSAGGLVVGPHVDSGGLGWQLGRTSVGAAADTSNGKEGVRGPSAVSAITTSANARHMPPATRRLMPPPPLPARPAPPGRAARA